MIILTVAVVAAGMLLIWAGLDHVRSPALAATIPWVGHSRKRLPAITLGVTEVVTGGAVIAVLVVPQPMGWVALGVQGVLFLAFLGFLLARYLRHDRDDCGCSRLATRIGMAGLLRTGLLAVASIVAAIWYPAVALPDAAPTVPDLMLLTAASATMCLLLHALPSAVDGLSRQIGTRRYA